MTTQGTQVRTDVNSGNKFLPNSCIVHTHFFKAELELDYFQQGLPCICICHLYAMYQGCLIFIGILVPTKYQDQSFPTVSNMPQTLFNIPRATIYLLVHNHCLNVLTVKFSKCLKTVIAVKSFFTVNVIDCLLQFL